MKDARDKGPDILDTVPKTFDRDHRDPDSFDVLLKLDARVVGDEYFKSGVDCSSEQDTVA